MKGLRFLVLLGVGAVIKGLPMTLNINDSLLTFDPSESGPDSFLNVAEAFVADHGFHTGAGCVSNPSCVSALIVSQMKISSGIFLPNKYLDLVRRGLSGELHTSRLTRAADEALGFGGTAWPALATTMVPAGSLDSLRWMIETCVRENVPARNVLEAGVWRGGASIFAAAVLDTAIGDGGGDPWTVILADSFRGLPFPSSAMDSDEGWWWEQGLLKVPESEVVESFTRYLPHIPIFGDDAVFPSVEFQPRLSGRVFKGFVRDSMPRVCSSLPPPGTPRGDIAVLRIDLDMYEAYTDTSPSPTVSPLVDSWSWTTT